MTLPLSTKLTQAQMAETAMSIQISGELGEVVLRLDAIVCCMWPQGMFVDP